MASIPSGEEIIAQRHSAQKKDLEAAEGAEAGVLGGLAPLVARAVMGSCFHAQASHAHVHINMSKANSASQKILDCDTICVPY